MPGGSQSHAGMLAVPGPAAAGFAWTQFLMSPVRSCPAIDADGRIYVADSVRLTCRTASGELLWSSNLGMCATGGTALGPGLDGRLQVYLGMRDPPLFVALDAATGVKRWQVSLTAPVDGAPAVGPDGTVYFGCDDGRVRAMTPTGTPVFEHPTGTPVRSSPAVGPDGTIYVVSHGGYLRALTAAGALLWSRYLGATSSSSAALGPDGLIYVGTDLGEAWCFRPTGDTVYRSRVGGPLGWPAVDQQGRVRYGSADRRLYALDQTGAVLWSVPTQGQIRPYMAPLVDPCGRTYFGSADGHLRGVDAQGQLLWKLNLGGEPGATAGAADGAIVAGTLSGMLIRTVPGAAPPGLPDPPPQGGAAAPGPLRWPPELLAPAPQGAAGWHLQPPLVTVDPFPGADWPEETVLLWQACGEQTQSGVIAGGPAVICVNVQGEVALSIRLEGQDVPEEALVPVVHHLRVDSAPPDVRLDWPSPGQWISPGSSPAAGLRVSDSGSGLAGVTILLDGRPYNPDEELRPGRRVLEVTAIDRAGHVTVFRREFGVGLTCSVRPLNPVVVLSGSGYSPPVIGRHITVMLYVPAAVAAAGHPEGVTLAGVPGAVVARLPSASAGGMRLYLARFPRESVENALAASVSHVPDGKLRRVTADVGWSCGSLYCVAALSLLFRP